MKNMLKKVFVMLMIVALLPLGFAHGVKALSQLSVSASPNTVSQNASYSLTFNTTLGVDTSHHITIIFPAGFTVPTPIPTNSIQINGQYPSSVSVSGTSITLAPSQNVGTYCYIMIYSSAGIRNPSTGGSYQITVSTDTPSETPNTVVYYLSIQTALQNVTVSVNPNTAGSAADFWINFTPGVALFAGDYIYINFPTGSTIPTSIACNLITVDGNLCACGTVVRETDTRISIRVPISLNAGINHVVHIPVGVNILNPGTAGTNYFIQLWTSREQTPVSSNPYSIIGSNISNLYVSVSPSSAGTAANYTIQFITGPSGALTSTSDWIKIEFPSGTTVPNGNPSYITVNGRTCTNRYVSGTALTIYLPSSLSISTNSWVYITISDAYGIVNPSSTGTYTLKISTSKDTIPATSNTYEITGTSISNLNITADPLTQNSNAEYTFTFRTSATGSLTANSDKIYIQFPTEFNVPTSIPGSYVTVNGTPCNTTVTVSSDKLTITTPINISYNTNVTIVISKSANIYNPPSSGTYTFELSTTRDVVKATDSLTIVKSTVSKPIVQLSSYGIGEPVQVQVQFTTGSGGALTTTDTISVVFPSGFTLPSSISQSLVKVNNYAAVSVTKSGSRFDIRPSISIPANSNVIIVIDQSANIRNPSTQGDYKISVYTSKETTQIDSDTFKIVNLPKTTISVTPAQPDGENGYYKTTPIVVLSATSPVDTAPQIYYYIDSGAQQLYSAPISIPDGTHTLYFFAKDRYGNTEQAQSRQFKVDTTKPTITIISPNDNQVLNSKDLTITGRISEIATLTINGANVAVKGDLTFEYSTTITGKTVFTFNAKDVAGNIGQAQLTVMLDTTPPKLVINKPQAFQTVNTAYVDVEGVTDADAVNVYVNGQKVQLGSNYTFTYRVVLTTEGLNSIEVIAEDLAGNQAKQSIPINYVAKTKIVLQIDNKNATLNDKMVQLDAPPKNVGGTTLVPIRFIATAFGAEVTWEPVFKLVIIKLGDTTIYLQIGVKYASLNGKKVTLTAAPQIISNYTYVPLRFISESFNADVQWEDKTKTITIIYPK
jgi:hypothetical protein